MQWFKSAEQAQRFLSAHGMIYGHFHPRRHLMTASEHRRARTEAFRVWRHRLTVLHGSRAQPHAVGALRAAPGPADGVTVPRRGLRGVRRRPGRDPLRPHAHRSHRRGRAGIAYDPTLLEMARHYGFLPRACRPYRPQSKGRWSGSRKPLAVPSRGSTGAARVRVPTAYQVRRT